MCGIHAVVALGRADDDDRSESGAGGGLSAVLCERLRRRGPDHLGEATATLRRKGSDDDGDAVRLRFTSTVLGLRGAGVTRQPFVDAASGSVLCWNGEVWRVDGAAVDREGGGANDGQQLFARLAAAPAGDGVLAALRAVEGPFAFVYYDAPRARLCYGRDRLGRRSLLVRTTGGTLTLSSVSDVAADASADAAAPWTEVEADGIYVVDLAARPWRTARHAWSDADDAEDALGDVVCGLGRFSMAADPGGHGRLTRTSPAVQELRAQLAAALRLRVLHVPRPPGARAGDDAGARADADTDTDTDTAAADTRVAVLFSGGLDCTVLARMAHDVLPSGQGVDLVNVAFENPRVRAHLAAGADVYEACPDRATGRRSLAELRRVCPARAWRFVAVNVPHAVFAAHRAAILALMHPHNTEMDLSIAAALYFAARGRGGRKEEDDEDDGTAARVLLSGLGADELFGGYGRHAAAFRAGGYAALARELHVDVARLGRRNLGRDDRVLAHWGREVRFPFLDERLVRWAIAQPAWAKCDFGDGVAGEAGGGAGEAHDNTENDNNPVDAAKRVLRLVAVNLGMAGVAGEKKRAIQFGARTAKMESGRVHGTAVVA